MSKEDLFRPGLEGIPACRSKIGYIDGKKGILEYRGIPIEKLAEHSTFEETSYLLLKGRLPTKDELKTFNADLCGQRALKPGMADIIKTLPHNGHPMQVLQAGVAAVGMFHPMKHVDDPEKRYDAICRLIAKLPTIVALFNRCRRKEKPIAPRNDLTHAANFLYMLTGKEPDPQEARLFDVCLILHADHTLNASTFSARVTASTLAIPYNVVSSAIGSLSGPLHGGANERVLKMLTEIGTVENVRPWIERRIEEHKKIMGLGHRVYKTRDPRAIILHALANKVFAVRKKSDLLVLAEEVEKVADEKLAGRGIYPNVDFYSGIVYNELGFPIDIFTGIFAMARISGWAAHWQEQLEDNKIFRPTQIDEAKRNQPYVPIEERN